MAARRKRGSSPLGGFRNDTPVPRVLDTLTRAIWEERRETEAPIEVPVLNIKNDGRGYHAITLDFDQASVVKRFGPHPNDVRRFRAAIQIENLLFGTGRFHRGPGREIVWGRIVHLDEHLQLAVLREDESLSPGTSRDLPALGPHCVQLFAVPYLEALDRWAKSLSSLPTSLTSVVDLPSGVERWAERYDREPERAADLRASQNEALAASTRRLLLLWGPPGTGKTRTLGAIIAGAALSDRKVVALSTTNVAVDLLTLAVDDAWRRITGEAPDPGGILRVGYPQLCALAEDPTRSHLLRWSQVLAEFAKKIGSLRKEVSRAEAGAESTEAALEVGRLRVRLQELEKERNELLKELVREARVVLTTFTSYVSDGKVHGELYDVTAVDEASMVPSAAVARLMDDPRSGFVFAGDFRQLAPVCVADRPAARTWFSQSLFETVGLEDPEKRSTLERFGVLRMLTEQSRMNDAICSFVSRSFYDGRLKALPGAPVPPRLPGWPENPLVLLNPMKAETPEWKPEEEWKPEDTPGFHRLEWPDRFRRSGSRYWWRSALCVRALLQALLAREDLAGERFVAATPYRAQARLLRLLCADLDGERLRVGTVHTLQGTEAWASVYDPVDARRRFPCDERLVNVALSRARAQVFVVSPVKWLFREPLKSYRMEAEEWAGPGAVPRRPAAKPVAEVEAEVAALLDPESPEALFEGEGTLPVSLEPLAKPEYTWELFSTRDD